MSKIIEIPFDNENIIAIENENGEKFISIKRICFNLGLDFSGQLRNIKNNPVLSKGVVITTIPTKGGLQEVSCLPLSKINGWLFQVDTNRMQNEQSKNKVIQYQEKCYDILNEYFNKKEIQPQLPTTYIEALKALVVAEEEKQALQQTIQEQAPQIEKYNLLHNAEGLYCLQEGMKILHLQPNKAIKQLRLLGFLKGANQPYQQYIDRGYFTIRTHTLEVDSKYKTKPQTYITVKGLAYFRERLDLFVGCASDKEIISF